MCQLNIRKFLSLSNVPTILKKMFPDSTSFPTFVKPGYPPQYLESRPCAVYPQKKDRKTFFQIIVNSSTSKLFKHLENCKLIHDRQS